MKKFILAFLVLFVANLACKKITKEPLCACSPISYPGLNLVVKNANGIDLLDATIGNGFKKDQIQLFLKDATTGNVRQISFNIRTPFNYGSGKFDFHLLHSEEIVRLNPVSGQQLYLKLGANPAYELNLKVNDNSRLVEKVTIDQKEVPTESTGATVYVGPIFYLTL